MSIYRRIKQYQYGFLLLAFLVLFFHFLPDQGLVFPSLKDAAHSIVFAVATYLLLLVFVPAYQLYFNDPQSVFYRTAGICLFAFFIGIVIEIAQPYVGRDRSLIDVIYDLLGCSAAGIFHSRKYIESLRRKRLSVVFASSLILLGLVYPMYNISIIVQRNLSAPLLLSFDQKWESAIVRQNAATELKISDAPTAWPNKTKVARVKFGVGYQYPGISFHNIYGQWAEFSSVSFEVFSEQQDEATLILRIHDTLHQNQYDDRFNLNLRVLPGLNNFAISLDDVKLAPKSREMQLDKIVSMILFMAGPEKPISLYIDNIELN